MDAAALALAEISEQVITPEWTDEQVRAFLTEKQATITRAEATQKELEFEGAGEAAKIERVGRAEAAKVLAVGEAEAEVIKKKLLAEGE